MEFPELIPIKQMEDYHTHYMGRFSDGRQFWGRERIWAHKPIPETGKVERHEFTALYIFDYSGNHITTKHKYFGKSEQVNSAVFSEMVGTLENWINSEGEWQFANILVKPFLMNIDGFEFGLLPNQEAECIELLPDHAIALYPPWDGEYYT
jgi:hypothetical protein